MRLIKSVAIVMAMALSLVGFNAQAKDFAEQKVVLQVSDKAGQTMALNVAGNLIKHYGQDQIDIQIVAFGPGFGLMEDRKENKNKNRVTSLAGSGVKFNACGNTLKKLTKKNKGKAPKLVASASVVSSGVVRIMELQDKGYKLIKP